MRTRFAPAPTGLLHLGHVANAIFVWGLARRRGADVLLRIEDHDRQRSRRAYEAQLLDDLDWLGFVPHVFPTDDFRRGPCLSRQSDRDTIYRHHAAALNERGLIYGCTCSRMTGPYAGTCRSRGTAPGDDVAWRMRIEPSAETFDDILMGPVTQEPARAFGDPVIRDRKGNWAYQFAVAVDDWLQGIDLVVRGRDLLESTGLQIYLARILGRPAPAAFAHHGLIMRSPAQKLSKSDGDTGIQALREAGWTPEAVIGHAARLLGHRVS